MSNKFICFMTFAVGTAIGSFVTWYCVKDKYRRIADDEIASVKEVFSKKEKNTVNPSNNEDGKLYSYNLHKCGYSNANSECPEREEENDMSKPYVITPDEFGGIDGYEVFSLTYYADEILTDDDDEVIEDVENTVGYDSLKHFGEYEDDSVFVRNDRRGCDYEILLDTRRYSDVVKTKPYLCVEE